MACAEGVGFWMHWPCGCKWRRGSYWKDHGSGFPNRRDKLSYQTHTYHHQTGSYACLDFGLLDYWWLLGIVKRIVSSRISRWVVGSLTTVCWRGINLVSLVHGWIGWWKNYLHCNVGAVCMSVCVCVHVCIFPSIHLSIHPSVRRVMLHCACCCRCSPRCALSK